ncbi:5666_t:CDS:2 [Paraglomus occultum]|uniref:5666_t:CDS:1 n=1 Tax=Paraglomus occultum TaxID=144539 RepID=A0A9N8Z8I8_9GLOM|nr:5666_t:CDS:2 [Paraglomus occultum]
MIQTPSDALAANLNPTSARLAINCTDPVPPGQAPLPRCISGIGFSYNAGQYDTNTRKLYRSARRTSHFTTFFGQYISFDIIQTTSNMTANPIAVPQDDATYNWGFVATAPLFNFNRTAFNDNTPAGHAGLNQVTSYLDLEQLYSNDPTVQMQLRDTASSRGYLKTGTPGYAPFDPNNPTKYLVGAANPKSRNLFVMAMHTVWLRNHNRLCDQLWDTHGTSWTDEQYYQEARRLNKAYYQKMVTEEYLGVVLGRPLPLYSGYNANQANGIDTVFASITMRYGHTELSDAYHMEDINGEDLASLPSNQINDETLLEKFSLEVVLRSLALLRQEEVDGLISDNVRNFCPTQTLCFDNASTDINRARDRGIPVYNTVRQAYGFAPANTFADITSNPDMQARLQKLYGTVDQVEAYIGMFYEDHLPGSNFGPTLNASMITQFSIFRDTDKTWYENTLSDDEKLAVRNTTFRDIVLANLILPDGTNFPQNVWTVQPDTGSSSSDLDTAFPGKVTPWTPYILRWRISGTVIQFAVDLATSSGSGWFGVGFGPTDDGMTGADMIIGIVSNGNVNIMNYYATGYQPPIVDPVQEVQLDSQSVSNGLARVQFSRSLTSSNSDKRKPIKNQDLKVIMAYNPVSSILTYHGNNRQKLRINFYTNTIASDANPESIMRTRIAHGISMFLAWGVIYPASAFIVRYYKHTYGFLKIHVNMQLLASSLVATMGAAVIATVSKTLCVHAKVGLVVYGSTYIQLGLGICSFWLLKKIESVNEGIPRILKRAHRYFGGTLIIAALFNIYLGIQQFGLQYGYNDLPLRIAFISYVSVVVLVFIFAELWRAFDGVFVARSCRKEDIVEAKTMLYSYLTVEAHSELPDFTWDEINERVQRGAFLVVCDGLVADIRKWINIHPGGAKILERVIGTDITNDFYDTHKIDLIKEKEKEEALENKDMIFAQPASLISPVLGEYAHLWDKRKQTQYRKTILTTIDDANIKIFHKSRVPIARHKHTAFATMQFATMVIGKVSETNYTVDKSLDALDPDLKSYFRPEAAPFLEFDIAKDTSNRVFRRYQLTDKEMINANPKLPVYRLTFTKVHQPKKAGGDRFLPGDYVELQGRVKGQVIVRSYTPIEGRMSNTFSIIVKIYPDGLMSQLLHNQLVGYEVKIRGPFDLSDRIGVSHLSQNELSTVMGRRFSSSRSVISNTSSDYNGHILLNPDASDGCWDELFMIAGGTGVTPMLQLIKYYLKTLASNRDRRLSMHLLYANDKVEDIIDGLKLEGFAALSKGMLTVTYILTKPPNNWNGLTGHINTEILNNWISHHARRDTIFNQPSMPQPLTSSVGQDSYYSDRTPDANYAHMDVDEVNNEVIQATVEDNDEVNQEVVNASTHSLSTTDHEIIGTPIHPSHVLNSKDPLNRHASLLSSSYAPTGSPLLSPMLSPTPSQSYYQMPRMKIVACGPSPMLLTVQNSLKDMGYSDDDIIMMF